MWHNIGLFVFFCALVYGMIDSKDELNSAGDRDLDDSAERLGPVVTQIQRRPYAASLLKNDTYVCSAVILNTYWLVTLSDCFDSDVISSYVTHKNLNNFTIRAGSSYNNKGGSLFKIKMLINNFDLKVSAVKLETPVPFGSRIQSVLLPNPDEEETLGYLASMIAWTPDGHIRVVNAPVIESSICDDHTKLAPGHYICLGGVQDPNRHFCRQDNGGAVIQNDTLIAVSTFLHTCAVYTIPHAFPKVSSLSRWLDSVIWDEGNRPFTAQPPTTKTTKIPNVTETSPSPDPYNADPNKFLLTLPFDPINVPLEPAEDNSVIPRMSLYESYLQNIARSKTSTTLDPGKQENRNVEVGKQEFLQKYGKAMMMPPMYIERKYEQNDYNK